MNKERDVISTLRKFAEGVYVGSQLDDWPGATHISVCRLPESPWKISDIDKSVVNQLMREIDQASRDGFVLITCKYGVNRAPSIAKLFCIGKRRPFNWMGSFPTMTWREFVTVNYSYYQRRAWK